MGGRGGDSDGVGGAAKMVSGTVWVRVETTPYDAVRKDRGYDRNDCVNGKGVGRMQRGSNTVGRKGLGFCSEVGRRGRTEMSA